MKHILKCKKCGIYTMKSLCMCKEKTDIVKPAKFDLEDTYGSYRRQVKIEDLKKRDLL